MHKYAQILSIYLFKWTRWLKVLFPFKNCLLLNQRPNIWTHMLARGHGLKLVFSLVYWNLWLLLFWKLGFLKQDKDKICSFNSRHGWQYQAREICKSWHLPGFPLDDKTTAMNSFLPKVSTLLLQIKWWPMLRIRSRVVLTLLGSPSCVAYF